MKKPPSPPFQASILLHFFGNYPPIFFQSKIFIYLPSNPHTCLPPTRILLNPRKSSLPRECTALLFLCPFFIKFKNIQ